MSFVSISHALLERNAQKFDLQRNMSHITKCRLIEICLMYCSLKLHDGLVNVLHPAIQQDFDHIHVVHLHQVCDKQCPNRDGVEGHGAIQDHSETRSVHHFRLHSTWL